MEAGHTTKKGDGRRTIKRVYQYHRIPTRDWCRGSHAVIPATVDVTLARSLDPVVTDCKGLTTHTISQHSL